ncbi:MAG: glycosyltransferase family 2 protein [Rhodoferax sp.]
MSQLSVTIITLNEAANIEACIDSVAFADEVVVLDSGSVDATVALARAKGARVVECQDWPGFGPQKNRALDLVRFPWVLSLDADERVPAALAAEIRRAISDPQAQAFEIPRLTQFCGRLIRHCGWTPDHVLRLFRSDAGRFSQDLVHERVVLQGGVPQRLGTALLHYSYPTAQHYWSKLQHYSQAWARQRFEQGQTSTMWRAGGAATVAFVKSYILRLGFLDGAMGFAVCALQAQAAFAKYFALYCLNRGIPLSND